MLEPNRIYPLTANAVSREGDYQMVALQGHPGLPSWLVAERCEAMQVDDQILNRTVFLVQPSSYGFTADGTGFLMDVECEGMSFLYVVTCRHVVRPTVSVRDLAPNTEPIWIRINREGDKPPKTIETKRSDWLYPTNRRIDVCVYPFDLAKHNPDNDLEVVHLSSSPEHHLIFREEQQRRWGLTLGDEVFMPSCFVGRVGDRKNIPVLRIGSIAAKPDEPIAGVSHQNPAYLIETRSLGGVSGSPVFLHLEPDHRRQTPKLIKSPDEKHSNAPYCLIGMMQGFHSGQYADDFIADGDVEKIVPADVDFNAGIGVAVPINQIMDLIDRSDLVEARMGTVEAKRKQTGHRDASSRRSEISSEDSGEKNPKHREDFNSLLGAAVRKREPEG
jgi:hypothetical protein